MAQTAFGVTLHVSDADTTYTATSSPTKLGEIQNVTPPQPSKDAQETTHMESTGRGRTYVGGLINHGAPTFTLHWTPGNATDALLRTIAAEATNREWRITFPVQGGSDVTCTFSAVLTSYTPDSPLGEVQSGSITLQVSGVPAWA